MHLLSYARGWLLSRLGRREEAVSAHDTLRPIVVKVIEERSAAPAKLAVNGFQKLVRGGAWISRLCGAPPGAGIWSLGGGFTLMDTGASKPRGSGAGGHPSGEVPRVRTVGHSTRTLEELVSLLKEHGVTRLVDVRTVPRSRHNPQFNRDTLPDALRAAGIAYVHMPGLGGLRHPRADSPNTAWRNDSFRGFADYMQTPQFAISLEELMALARREPVALMCAEALPWRCHRSLIADALLARGIPVDHILGAGGPGSARAHTLTAWARVDGDRVTYPGVISAHGARPKTDRRESEGG